ncbi:LysR family transcriptional regulator [Aureimonas sp. AU20]|uniref:LysR family transcriptional regulator n=1 Tax=Aureimonas sp. AU20 TaxID=1349819 RepID=UPI001FCE12D6|nr:LysR family transcriptional regulator [Aureimonas sp. AU20]
MALFVRIVERGSFTGAAAELGISRPTATAAIQELERRLGVRLLHRTTRQVRPTREGEAYYHRCVAILRELEEADRTAAGTVSGLLRIDVAGLIARTMLLPALPEFLSRHPNLNIHLSESERFVDLVREGVDCVVRAGELADSGMVGRTLGAVEEITCASPAYLSARGTPASPDNLEGHQMIGFVSSRTGQPLPLQFTVGGKIVEIALPARILVSGSDTSAAAARLGFGIVQAPRYRFAEDLASGALTEIMSEYPPTPTPISILFPDSRHLSPRVRAFVDWAAEILAPYLLR